MPFGPELKNAKEAIARMQALVKELWGVEDIHHLFPGLVVRVGGAGIEVTPVLKSEEWPNSVVLFGSTADEYLKIYGHGLGMGRESVGDDRKRLVNNELESTWVRAVETGGSGFEEQRVREGACVSRLLGVNEDDVRYLFDSVPIHPVVGGERRVYFVNCFDEGDEDPLLLKTFAFLFDREESGVVLGGTVESKEAS